jgi:cytochrome P450
VREVAFYLLAGAHTSATAFTRVTHHIFGWLESTPKTPTTVRTDRLFVQRCTHETVRLQPSSPVAMRWALADIELKSGSQIPRATRWSSTCCRSTATRPCSATAPTCSTPAVRCPTASPAYGLSFGSGMHACIGQDLAAGLVFHEDDVMDAHLFGLVPEAVQRLFDHGARPDPDDPPEMDDSTARPYFGRYPIVFHG